MKRKRDNSGCERGRQMEEWVKGLHNSFYLLASTVALLEVLMPQQIPSKWCHWLNVASCDFIQIFKLLQTTQGVFSNMWKPQKHWRWPIIWKRTAMFNHRGEKDLLHYWSTECAPSWMRSLCLLLSRPHADRCHQQPETHLTLSGWNILMSVSSAYKCPDLL